MDVKVYLHHDAYSFEGKHLPTVNAQHKSENYPESSLGFFTFYQYFIEQDGEVIQCRPEMDLDVVYKEAHEDSISICLAGNFNNEFPTVPQKVALDELIYHLWTKYRLKISSCREHRDYQDTSCPGKLIPKNFGARLLTERRIAILEADLLKRPPLWVRFFGL